MRNNKAIAKSNVVRRFKDACNDLAETVNAQLFDSSRSFYWVADVVGDSCDFGEVDFLNPEDMVLIIENQMTYSEYAEWRDANLDNENFINLKSWLKGARHDMLEKTNKTLQI